MRSILVVLLSTLLFGCFGLAFGSAQEAAAPAVAVSHAADWLPDSTQGFARIVDFTKFLERIKATQFGKLADDERLQPFWKDQRKTIEGRFAEAGWQMNVTGDDIAKVAGGQVAVAWISKPQVPQKPYAVALIIDVAGKQNELNALMAKIDTELKARQATSKKLEQSGTTVTQYTLPRGAGELVIHESFYAVLDNYFVATDELAALQDILSAKKLGRADALGKSELFKKSMARIPTADADSDVQYFVRPIGLAKLLRSISGKPVTSQTDILKVLDAEGFGKLSAVAGRMQLGQKTFDVYHEAFVQTEPPLPTSVQILDFPNLANGKIPSWVTPKAASYLSTAWNAKEAFWKMRTLVDNVAGQPGVFDSVIEGIENDPNGPRINIRKHVLPYITPEIYSVNDVVKPVTTESRRSLIGIRINDPEGKLAEALERAMQNEPDASPEDFEEFRIWKVTREEDSDESLNVQTDFGFGDKKKTPPKEDEPLLSNWAITIFSNKTPTGNEQFLMFASHAEMIKEAIKLGKAADANNALDKEADVARVVKELQTLAKNETGCLWEINRSDRAYEMQYELFRQDKLPQSKSMLATILDRILRPKDELKKVQQEVKGDKLPPFAAIQQFFMPGGSRVVTHLDGWSYQGFILAK